MTTRRTWDTVVVGAGLGGLTAGATLAQRGRDVLVLERHSIPGGCATTFDRGDFEFEVSLHEIEGLDEHDPKRAILEDLGVFDALSFEPVDDLYRYTHGETDLVVPHGVDAAIDALTTAFPHEERGIQRFFRVLTDLRSSLASLSRTGDFSLPQFLKIPFEHRTFFRYRNATLGEFLDEIIEDDELKLVLTGNLGYYHDDPYSLSLPYYAAGQGGYFIGGGHYITGGSIELSEYLVECIEDHGGRVALERRVTDLHVEDGSITEVVHHPSRPGSRQTATGPVATPSDPGEVRTERAEYVIANAAIPLVASQLLPDPYGQQLAAQFDGWEYAPSITTLYLGFDRPPGNLGTDHYTTVLTNPGVEDLGDAIRGRQGSFGTRSLNFVDYSQLEADLGPSGAAVGALSTLDYESEWTGLTDTEYREKKARVTDVLLRRLGDAYPRLPDAVSHAELATPQTIRRFTLNPGGTAYGFAQTPEQSMLSRRIEAPVPNLGFASAWTFPGGGFTGAIMAGSRAAHQRLDRTA
ncbi:phytoene desaturase family protein [Haloarchaeobius amylolyticus]|uniref:phytoene desaturase family protein n=1 Tax=Haloarchaeobius amylolyticus TaxID=1198296 RepID=UPI00226DD045|nr:NAD(P)/FAD-dependent oxidoreductase [Haloarchaeobius amylolyticus]